VSTNFKTYMNKDGAILTAFEKVGYTADLCGLGIAGVPLWATGGYTYLHRDVPMYFLSWQDVEKREASFNYLIGADSQPTTASSFKRLSCAENAGFHRIDRVDICIYHRPGHCVAAEGRFENTPRP
jgi:GPI mannosyltransferase 3